MLRIAKLHSNTNGNSHTVDNVICIIMSLRMAIVFEMLLFRRFSSQPENHYYNRCCEINKEKLQVKLITYE
jgi:hypothetical protein